MPRKTLIWIGLFISSVVGSYIPVLWGAIAVLVTKCTIVVERKN